MNTALERYEQDEQVMHINGWLPPFSSLPEASFFSSVMACWGWATWKKSWHCFQRDPDYFIQTLSKMQRFKLNINNVYDNFNDIMRNQSGAINTWAVFWYASILLKKGLCLSPSMSLTNNISIDSSGTNFSYSTQKYETPLAKGPITHFPDKIEDAYVSFYKSHKLGFWGHVKSKSKKIFNLFSL